MSSADKKYRVLVVGCGTISKQWIPVLKKRPDCEICAVVDINPEVAAGRIADYGISCPVYDDFDAALANEQPDIVADLSFAACHHDITVKALRAGCHVFGEKPMANSREDALEMLRAAKDTGKTYDVLQDRRFLNGTRGLRHAVQSGMLGDIWMTCCELYVGADLRSIRNSLPYPMLQDQAVHSFDSARFILEANAKTVYAHSYHPKDSPYNGDAAGACIFEMDNNSVLVYNAVMGTRCMVGSWHSQWRIIGSKGTAVWNGAENDLAVAEIRQEDGSVKKVELLPPPEWKGIALHEGAIDEMFSDLAAGNESKSSCHYNYGSMAMEFSALDSIKLGKKVKVN